MPQTRHDQWHLMKLEEMTASRGIDCNAHAHFPQENVFLRGQREPYLQQVNTNQLAIVSEIPDSRQSKTVMYT